MLLIIEAIIPAVGALHVFFSRHSRSVLQLVDILCCVCIIPFSFREIILCYLEKPIRKKSPDISSAFLFYSYFSSRLFSSFPTQLTQLVCRVGGIFVVVFRYFMPLINTYADYCTFAESCKHCRYLSPSSGGELFGRRVHNVFFLLSRQLDE